MRERTVQLVLQYDGSRFAGWQRQPTSVTVQGAIEDVLERLFERRTTLIGAGRTDAGVHARGQVAHVRVPETWDASKLRRALNSLLPPDIWIAKAHNVTDQFHARYSAVSRRYTYQIGTDEESASPFRRRYEWRLPWSLPEESLLSEATGKLLGEHQFFGFAVRGTAPQADEHRCTVTHASWNRDGGRLDFTIEANRFLHHMVRFLVGTMIDIAAGRRTLESFAQLLAASSNHAVSPPAPSHGLFLEHVGYPPHFYPEEA
ncbi:MAG TPA: tRNA pseudouridine(38-40) synthase TruA [Gemmatimonadaceae bacterium]|jgi:tRNA pseudouridine38-40 synthase